MHYEDKQRVIAYVAAHPDLSYPQIAKQLNISRRTLQYVIAGHIKRERGPKLKLTFPKARRAQKVS